MADDGARPPPESDPGAAGPIASISPASDGVGDAAAAAIKEQLAELAVADEEPVRPSGCGEDVPVIGDGGGGEVAGEKLPAPAAPATVAGWSPRFPRRPGEPDCTYYLKFGSCRFGVKCKFNHPARHKKNRVKWSGSSGSGSNSSSGKACSPDDEQQIPKENEDLVPDVSAEVDSLKRRVEPMELKVTEETEKVIICKFYETDQKVAKEISRETFPNGNAQEECKYYSMPGGCKYGRSCKYLHREGKERKTESENFELNFLGLPLRPGVKECPFYMRTGSCKFATNCRYHHPDPTNNVASKDPGLENENGDTIQQNVQGSTQLNVSIWPADQTGPNEQHAPFLALTPSYNVGMIPHQGIYPSHEWNAYHQVPLGPYYPPGYSFHQFPAPPVNHHMYKVADVPGHHQLPSGEYPERPGKPECQHFVRTGFCKFGMKCRHHHPRPPVPPSAGVLSPLGLPLKPDQPVCTYYGRFGVCKFGPDCAYNHPFNYGHPVAPPPLPVPPLSGQPAN